MLDLADLAAEFAEAHRLATEPEAEILVAEGFHELIPEALVLREEGRRQVAADDRVHAGSMPLGTNAGNLANLLSRTASAGGPETLNEDSFDRASVGRWRNPVISRTDHPHGTLMQVHGIS